MERTVFTNGCFDILHPGHVDLLERARALGTRLIVGINSDASVRKIKGYPRPFVPQDERELVLRGLRSVDEVHIFDEPTPQKLIEELKPDVLVKGGDWQISEIIGADFVLKRGGEVFSLPLKENYSSSRIIEKIQGDKFTSEPGAKLKNGSNLTTVIENSLRENIDVFTSILEQTGLAEIEQCAELIYQTLVSGKKILLCGNGESAADARHLAAELSRRFETERKAFPAIVLTTDTAALTALANDDSFERIFSRQVEALADEGDLLIALSTSGDSPNIIAAVMTARNSGCRIIGMTGKTGKKLAALCDGAILVPAMRSARIQEAHMTVGHIWCEIIEFRIRGV